jgi:hypothetical protein
LKGENVKPKYGKNHWGWTGHEEIYGSYWRQLKLNAMERKHKFNLTIEYAWKLFIKQNRKCALSGVQLEFPKFLREKADTLSRPSLDRIDSTKGYIKGNVQWVSVAVNYMKLDYSQSEFINLCKLIASHNS